MPLWLLTILACGLSAPSSPVLTTPSQTGAATPPEARDVTANALARDPEAIQHIVLPRSNRPKKARAPRDFGLIAPLQFKWRVEDTDVYSTPLPVHSNLMPTKIQGTHSFGSGPPPGFRVKLDKSYLRFFRNAAADNSYGFNREELLIDVPTGSPAPDGNSVSVSFLRATKHEDKLNAATADQKPRDFITRNVTLDAISHTGLYLPAPASASWNLTVPEAGVLGFRGIVMPPAIRTADRSDGASVIMTVLEGDTELASHVVTLKVDSWDEVRWDLSDHAGKKVTLNIATEPGLSPVFDYVFLEDPVVYTPSENPRRTLVVFIDTLRPDHLGTYGYERATSPGITAWSEHAAVFENARSVAPWTLPSARSALSGQQPEDWYDHPNLPERFSQAGFHSEAIVANAFLSQPFDMHRGFSRFQYEHLMTATDVSAAATEVFAAHPDRDVFLMVHYMDPHLPYEEGPAYRFRWARLPPSVRMSRLALMDVHPDDDNYEHVRDYTIARYDQNIRYVDDELVSVLDSAGLDATVVLFSDHGEEFWDHDSFEHGHTFYDELLRVPMIVRSPHVPPGHYEAPVSLLDIAPTALALEGLPPTEGPGLSLVDLLHGVNGADDELLARPQAFGRPLYNNDGWAVLDDGNKWISRDGKQSVYAMSTDRDEQSNIAPQADLERFPEALQEALSRDVHLVWRVKPKTRLGTAGTQITLTHPEGFSDAWAAYDPRGRAASTKIVVRDDGSVLIDQPRGAEMPTSVYLVPNGDPRLPQGLNVSVTGGGRKSFEATSQGVEVKVSGSRQVLLEEGSKGWSVIIDTSFVPLPSGVAVSAFHEDVQAQLKELGYTEEE